MLSGRTRTAESTDPMYQKYPGITNEEFVRLLSLTATDLGEPWNKQGFGMLNVRRLLENK